MSGKDVEMPAHPVHAAHRLSRTVGLCLLLTGGCITARFGALTEVKDVSPAARDCSECHVEIYREFEHSPHAGSWTDDTFVEETAQYALETCLGCHAPESIYVDGPPVLRKSRREEGVTCISCHFDDGVLAGPAPRSALVDPHPVAEKSTLFGRSELCGKCHEGTFREWQEAPLADKRTCQDCHMQRVTRKLTQPTDTLSAALVFFEDEYEGRRHDFGLKTVDRSEPAIQGVIQNLRSVEAGVGLDVVLTNRLPHFIPTGDYGYREAMVVIEGLGAAGEARSRREIRIFTDLGNALAPLEPRRFPVVLAQGSVSVRAGVLAKKRGPEARLLFEKTWRLP